MAFYAIRNRCLIIILLHLKCRQLPVGVVFGRPCRSGSVEVDFVRLHTVSVVGSLGRHGTCSTSAHRDLFLQKKTQVLGLVYYY